MSTVQQTNSNKIFSPATNRQRAAAAVIFIVVFGLFSYLWAAADGKLDTTRIFGVCGFREAVGLPCLGCYMTRSGMAFAKGRIMESFYIQPAAAFFCCVLAVIALFALLTAVFGVQLKFLHGCMNRRVAVYLVVWTIIILGCGWAVTLSRALAERNLP